MYSNASHTFLHKQPRYTLPGTGLNITKLESKKYQNVEDGKNSAKRWASSANKRLILQRLHRVDTCIDNLENELVKMNNELDHMKTMRKHLAYDIVSLGLAVKGVELTEKSILPTKSVQTQDEQYQTDEQQVRELEEARAVEMILDDQKYNKAMELMPPELKDMNFSPEINLQIYEKMKENPTKTIILSLMDDNQVTLQATDKELDLLPNEEVAAQSVIGRPTCTTNNRSLHCTRTQLCSLKHCARYSSITTTIKPAIHDYFSRPNPPG